MEQKQHGTESKSTVIQNNTEKTHKEDYLTDNIPLENGFVIRKRDNKWFTTLGDTMITEPTEKYTEQLTQIDDINYKVLIKIIIHVIKCIKVIDKIDDKMTPIITPDGARHDTL